MSYIEIDTENPSNVTVWNGETSYDLYGVHLPGQCRGQYCVIHKPRATHMDDWHLHWRDDRGIFERICEHGIGHPAPEQWGYTDCVHGCDGCCWIGDEGDEDD